MKKSRKVLLIIFFVVLFLLIEVSVSNHRITNISSLQHDNVLGSAAESIVNDAAEATGADCILCWRKPDRKPRNRHSP